MTVKNIYKAYAVKLIRWLDSWITKKLTCVLLLGLIATWLLYGLIGHRLIEAMYRNTSSQILGHTIMAGKSITPLEDYLEAADTMIVVNTLRLVAIFSLAAFLIKKPLALLYGSCVVAVLSFFVFCLIELFPFIGDALYLDEVNFYYYNKLYIADDKLVHKLRPHIHTHSRAYKYGYPPLYGIQVQSTTIDWTTDDDGFRNAATTKFNDVVIIGDGFIEEGHSLADTFAYRLEKRLAAIRVGNLGTGGYGPFQYLEVLSRYGIKRNPKYALIAFNEVNDIFDIERYLQWEKGKGNGLSFLYDSRTGVISKAFFERYIGTLIDTFNYIQKVAFTKAHAMLEMLDAYQSHSPPVHKDLVLVELGKKAIHRMLFIDQLITKSTDEILGSDNGRRLKELLTEFKNLCVKNKIVPMIMFIPSAAHIYGEYSTQQSGRNWLKIRAEQIAAKANVEQAISALARTLDIELINLSNVFESAAKNGKMLYYPLSTHWNSEGMEVAAAFVADALKSRITAPAQRVDAASK